MPPIPAPACAESAPPAWPAGLWRADQLDSTPGPTCPSGHTALDAELPGGGWPQGLLTELLLAEPGPGEWRLLAPVLQRLTQGGPGEPGRAVVCIGRPEPWRAYGPGLDALGLALPRLIWVDTTDEAEGAWATEQALRSGAAAAVLWWAWSGAPRPINHPDTPRPNGLTQQGRLGMHLRRLHLAAQARPVLLWVLRPLSAAAQSSPAALRLACRVEAQRPGQLQLELLKRRGPPLAEPLTLALGSALGPTLAHRLSLPLPLPSPTRFPPTPQRTPSRSAPTPASAHDRPVALPAPAAPAAGRAGALA